MDISERHRDKKDNGNVNAKDNVNNSMSLYRKNYIIKTDTSFVPKDKLVLNIVNIIHGDTCDNEYSGGDDDDEEEGEFNLHDKRYQIRIFGVTLEGLSVQIDVNNFNPYFYVEVPDHWKIETKNQFVRCIKSMMMKRFRETLIESECKLVGKEKYMGFTNHKQYKFVKFVFNSWEGMKKCSYVFGRELNIGTIGVRYMKFNLYENNMDPFLRFIHKQEIEPCNMIILNLKKCKITDHDKIKLISRSDIHIICDYENILPLRETDKCAGENDKNKSENCSIVSKIKGFPRILCAAFDIECTSSDGGFPNAGRKDDAVIMVCTTFRFAGVKESCLRVIHHLKKSLPIDGCVMIECKDERKLLIEWAKLIRNMNPDIIYGYNSSGFDFKYMYDRSCMFGCNDKFLDMSRIVGTQCTYVEKRLASSALGDNVLKYIDIPGIIIMDVMKEVQKEPKKLDMYKLDFVLETYLGDHKVDLPPDQIFAKYKSGSADDIYEISVYCLKDTDSCHDLVWCNKLNLIIKAMKLSDVCLVPLEYIFNRGQGIRIFSLIGNECMKKNFVIPYIKKVDNKIHAQSDVKNIIDELRKNKKFNNGKIEIPDSLMALTDNAKPMKRKNFLKLKTAYEAGEESEEKYLNLLEEILIIIIEEQYKADEGFDGAIVFEAKPGIYHNPIIVNDFASLYPNCQRAWNLSHDTIVLDPAYGNLSGLEYENVEYRQPNGKIKVCRFVQVPAVGENSKLTEEQRLSYRGMMPNVIDKLLKARKDTRKRLEGETDPGVIAQLDALQLTYKVIVNSLYGQCGASTSQIYMKDLAACTTALGRRNLTLARDTALKLYGKYVKCIYGDTDSVFFEYNCKKFRELDADADSYDEGVVNEYKIKKSIEMGHKIASAVNIAIGKPGIMDFEYEKTFLPFLQVSKKRYYGRKYETDPRVFKDNVMGLATKRRNYCKYTKDTMQHIFNMIMNSSSTNINGVTEYVLKRISNLIDGIVPLEELKITASLKSSYKNENVAHNQLAIRMRARGETVNANDRIAFVFTLIKPDYNTKGVPRKKLDADIVEELGYAIKNNLKYDAEKYIEGQLREPVSQILDFLVDDSKEIFDSAIALWRQNIIKIYGDPVIPERKRKAATK